MFAQGGNAADAAIAVAATLMVVEPVSSGLGADAFALVYQDGTVSALNASGRAPLKRLPEYRGGRIPDLGWPSVTVPGAVSGWVALSDRYGRLPFANLLQPAIRYACEGYLVTPLVARIWRGLLAKYMKFPQVVELFYTYPRGPQPGSVMRFPQLADSLEQIADSRGEALYRGRLAERIHEWSEQSGGHLTAADLAAQHAVWTQPVSASYRGLKLAEQPPNSQGIAALIALGVLEHFEIAQYPVDSAESWHLQIEATRLALADTYAQVGDPEAMTVLPRDLLEPERLKRLAATISLDEARFPEALDAPYSGGTSYLTVADAQGLVVSYIQSSGPGFGSGIVVPGTGIALQSRAGAFHPDPSHANGYAPGKRPFHTNCPALATLDGAFHSSFGLMGWSMQPQAHLQFMVRSVDFGQNPQAALDAPRWRIAVEEPAILVEPHTAPAVVEGLIKRGHRIVKTERFLPASTPFGSGLMFGGAQMILALAEGYVAGSDRRRDGGAVAL
jgi:gamma-glutamyltranspeptidase / glutathione hydrolase